MSLLEKIISFLSYKLQFVPQMYDWFHLLFLTLTILITIFIIIKYKYTNDKNNRNILLFFSILMLVFEVYKQLVFSYRNDSWKYQWYIFPFQFCSVPMYIAFITAFLKKGKIKTSFYAFLGTYSLFAGLAVMLYPVDVFVDTLGISIQTMVHHGSMVVLGVYCLANKTKYQHKTIFKATLVFSVLLVIAFLLNIGFRNVNGTFNMFFIGPFYDNHLPILSMIQKQFGYLLFLISYVFGFSLIAYLMLLVAIFIHKLSFIRYHKHEKITAKL